MISEAWKLFGFWTTVVVWGGLLCVIVLPIVARRLSLVLSNVRTRPIGAVLCLLLLGFVVAYGGSKSQPVDPTNPDTPVSPTDPTDPSGPSDPDNPSSPDDPSVPSDPTNPDTPVSPTDPTDPSGPSDPDNPSNPDDPSVPSDPTNPDTPVSPTDPTDPSGPSDPDNPSNPDDPSVPSDPTNPDNPSNPDDPSEEATYVLYETVDGVMPAVAASEYNGYLYDENSGEIKGTIQVKVGKPGKKDGKASVRATVVVGTKKTTLKAADKGKAAINPDGPTEIELVGGAACEIALGAEGISGTYGAYLIDGARNFFTSKDKGDQSDANAVLGKWLGSVNIVWDGGSVANVSIAKKGKVKVKGTLANGTKVSVNASFLVGDEWCAVPVAAPKANLSFTLWLSRDGRTAMVEGLGNDVHVGEAGSLASGSAFYVLADDSFWDKITGEVYTKYLPDGVPVTRKGTKWTLPKAGKITMKKGEIDESKKGDNPSGLKLTYKAKDGSFKGSFKVYAKVNGKLKTTTVNVTGVMVGATGYGTATIKKVGSVDVMIK